MVLLLASSGRLAGQLAPVDPHLRQGIVFLNQKQQDRAIVAFKKAVAAKPNSAEAHLLLGQAYLAKRAPELVAEAKAEFQQARELNPGLAQAGFYIAKIDLDLGRLASAEAEISRSLQVAPGASYLVALLAEVRRQQGKPRDAVELVTKALAADPNALPALSFRAQAYWDLGDEEKALADLRRLLAASAASTDAYLLLGTIHLAGGRLDEAESALRKVTQEGPNPAASLKLAAVLRQRKRLADALRELEKVEEAPQLSSAYYERLAADAACERGLILEEQGNRAAAKEAFTKAIEFDPEHAEALRRLKAYR
ncbi:MAG: tetratricopeptide repeat protein [Bryobacterales bacterium]|nr:tetratricopeptide repeat protein [Bryobacterales bacterium]